MGVSLFSGFMYAPVGSYLARVWFRISLHRHWMPLPLAVFFVSMALWVAENVGTATGTWLYSG